MGGTVHLLACVWRDVSNDVEVMKRLCRLIKLNVNHVTTEEEARHLYWTEFVATLFV